MWVHTFLLCQHKFIQIKLPLLWWTQAGLIWLIIESDAQNTLRDLCHQRIPTKLAKEAVSWICFCESWPQSSTKFSKTALGLILEANLGGYIKHNPPKAFSKATLEGCIMSSPTIQAIQAMKASFAPRKPEIVLICKTSVLLYPKVDPSMSDPEKAMALLDIDRWLNKWFVI